MSFLRKHIRKFEPEKFINSISPAENFEPSTDVKKLWLGVRHSKIEIGINDFPGLFSLDNLPDDKKGFYLAITLEAVGLIFMFPQFKILFIGIASVLSLLILDLICAVKGHSPQKVICLNENKIKAGVEQYNVAALKQEISHNKKVMFLWKSGIIIIAFVKVILFVILQRFRIDPVSVLILVSYCVVAYYHIRRTGYYWAAKELIKELWKEYDKCESSQNGLHHINDFRKFPIETTESMKNANSGKHQIVIENGKCYFKTWGILFDDDLKGFIDFQEEVQGSNKKSTIGREGLKHQLEIMRSNPKRVGEADSINKGVENGNEVQNEK